MAKKKNKLIESADEMYNVLTGDAELKRLEEIRMMSYMEEQAALEVAKRDGEAIGLSKGEAIGRKNTQEETAKKMLEKKLAIEDIAELTGLTKEEIEKLKTKDEE